MKLQQSTIIKQYFIDYMLGKYNDNNPHVPQHVAEELRKEGFEDELNINLLKKATGTYSVIFESDKVLTHTLNYVQTTPNHPSLFSKKFLKGRSFPDVKEVPRDIEAGLLCIGLEDERSIVMLVPKDFDKKSDEEKVEFILNHYYEAARVDFENPEEIAGTSYALANDVSLTEDGTGLVMESPVIKGTLRIVNDIRVYELEDAHMGKLSLE